METLNQTPTGEEHKLIVRYLKWVGDDTEGFDYTTHIKLVDEIPVDHIGYGNSEIDYPLWAQNKEWPNDKSEWEDISEEEYMKAKQNG